MAILDGALWEYNLCKIVIVDVSDDYRLMQPPMPASFYPVLSERWLPNYNLQSRLPKESFVEGYLYDWHELPNQDHGAWVVGVVDSELFPD